VRARARVCVVVVVVVVVVVGGDFLSFCFGIINRSYQES